MKKFATFALGLAVGIASTGAAAYAIAPVDMRHQCEKILHIVKVKVPGKTRIVRPKPKPPVVETRFFQNECRPIILDIGQPNTAFTIEDQDIPWLAGATRNPPSHYRIDYGYPVNGGQIITPATPATPAPSSVPEPASWAMMVAGFGMLGGVMRRRKSHLQENSNG